MKPSRIPPIVRVLMCTDGTVTRSLQAYFDEAIDVQVVSQSWERLAAADQWLHCPAGDDVVCRQVRLQGKASGKVYAYAETVLQPDRLPESVRQGLLEGAFGIGELMQLRGLETYREVLRTGAASDLPWDIAEFSLPSERLGYMWRHYTIRHNEKVLMHIQEYFPLAAYL